MRIRDWSSDVCSSDLPEQRDSTDPSTASHTRLFFAVFDCSWRNARIGPTGPTTVHQIHDQLKSLEKEPDIRVHAERIETDCARANWLTRPDQGRPIIDDRLEQMYQRLAAQTELWLEQTLIVQISRSEENTSEIQSLKRISYSFFCCK